MKTLLESTNTKPISSTEGAIDKITNACLRVGVKHLNGESKKEVRKAAVGELLGLLDSWLSD